MSSAQHIDTLLRDPLRGITAAEGATGFVGADVPLELLLATQRPFGHLPWQTERQWPWAARWLESGFPGWAFSILEDWHQGRFDTLRKVVFSRAEDAAQRLYYYVRDLQRRGELGGPEALILDVALIPRDSSLQHTAAAIRETAAALDCTEDDLRGAMPRADALRLRLAALQAVRGADGPHFEKLGRAALFSDASRWIGEVPVEAARRDRLRVLLAGSVPPDERLHAAAESGGASIVAETHVHALSRHGAPLPGMDESPSLSIARALVTRSIGPRSFIDRPSWILREARQARAQAVVLWLTREEEALAWHVPGLRRALAEADLPVLVLSSARWQGDDGAPEAIAQFCRSVAAGSDA